MMTNLKYWMTKKHDIKIGWSSNIEKGITNIVIA